MHLKTGCWQGGHLLGAKWCPSMAAADTAQQVMTDSGRTSQNPEPLMQDGKNMPIPHVLVLGVARRHNSGRQQMPAREDQRVSLGVRIPSSLKPTANPKEPLLIEERGQLTQAAPFVAGE